MRVPYRVSMLAGAPDATAAAPAAEVAAAAAAAAAGLATFGGVGGALQQMLRAQSVSHRTVAAPAPSADAAEGKAYIALRGQVDWRNAPQLTMPHKEVEVYKLRQFEALKAAEARRKRHVEAEHPANKARNATAVEEELVGRQMTKG